MRHLILAVLALMAAGPGLPAQTRSIPRIYDLRALERSLAVRSFEIDALNAPFDTWVKGDEALRRQFGRFRRERIAFASDPPAELALRLAGVPAGDIESSEEQGLFVLRASEEIHARFARSLRALERESSRAARVRLVALPGSVLRDEGRRVLDPADVAARLRATHGARVFETVVRLGQTAPIESVAREAFVMDYDAEVAQGASIADPVIGTLTTGLLGSVRVDGATGGRLLLRMQGRTSRLSDADLPVVDIGSQDAGRVHLPCTIFSACAATAVVPSGGGILVGACEGSDGVFLVTVTEESLAEEARPEGLLPAAELLLPRRRTVLLGPADPRPTDTPGELRVDTGDDDEDQSPRLTRNDLIERLRLETRDGDMDDILYQIAEAGTVICTPGAKGLPARVREVLETAARDRARTITIELRAGHVAAGAADSQEDAAAIAASLGTCIAATAVAGDDFAAITGSQTAYVKDHDVEIAQDASTGDPVIASVFTGLAVSGRIDIAGPDGCRFDGAVTVTEPVAPAADSAPVPGARQRSAGLRTFPIGASRLGAVELPRVRSTRLLPNLLLDAGKWQILHRANLPGTETTLVIAIRASF